MASKLLLVEDDQVLRDLYLTRFKMEGYDVDVATDGETALAQAGASIPACILLDLRIPKLSGFEVLRRLKEQPATKDIPVIVLTALSGDEDRQKVMQLGAKAFLTKAETMPKDVLAHVREAIGPAAN